MLSTFNLILAFMTAVDTIFLVSSIIEYSIVQAFKLSSLEYDKLFVYFLYPTHNVTLVCSIYLHVVMAFERYLAVCHPELVYAGQPRRRGNHQINSEQESKTIRKKVKNIINRKNSSKSSLPSGTDLHHTSSFVLHPDKSSQMV